MQPIVYLTEQLNPYTTQPFMEWVQECMKKIPVDMRDVVTMEIKLEGSIGDGDMLQFAEWSYDPRTAVSLPKLQALLKEHRKFRTMVTKVDTLLPNGKGGDVLFFTGEHPYIHDELYTNQQWAYPPLVLWLKVHGWTFVRDYTDGTAPHIIPFEPTAPKS